VAKLRRRYWVKKNGKLAKASHNHTSGGTTKCERDAAALPQSNATRSKNRPYFWEINRKTVCFYAAGIEGKCRIDSPSAAAMAKKRMQLETFSF
jgi:hypothetical protein